MLIETDHPKLSVTRQCELLGLPRSSLYYTSHVDDTCNERLMRLLDEQYTRTPFYGVPRMTACLRRRGHVVNPKRVRRLMRVMGLEAIYPKPRLSMSGKEHRIYPYLLRGVKITHPDHVWSTDITYIRMHRGFVYLAAIMDWFSRYVVAWEVSVNLEADFCIQALEQALATAQPEIFNSDQGSQFTSEGFTRVLESRNIRISMDGRGRVFDNIFVERLWRSVKYEEVYLKDYEDVWSARTNLGRYFEFYNHERPHQALDYQTPAELYRTARNRKGARRADARPVPAVTPVALPH